jgi:GNAT superfamily N-acetyltransferase
MRFASFAAKRFSSACGKNRPSSRGESFSVPSRADEVEIRRARLSDAPAVAELSGQLGYPTPEREMADRLAHLIRHPRFGAVLIAENSDGKIVGWLHVSVTPLLEVELRAEVNGLIVAEGQRSSGSGAKLLEAAEAWAKSKACASMSVRSNVVRDRAHAFYLRNGYEHYKTQKAFRKAL